MGVIMVPGVNAWAKLKAGVLNVMMNFQLTVEMFSG